MLEGDTFFYMLVFPSIDLTFFGLWQNKIPSFEVLLTSTDRAIQFFVTLCVRVFFSFFVDMSWIIFQPFTHLIPSAFSF